jgi:hypothetical protein
MPAFDFKTSENEIDNHYKLHFVQRDNYSPQTIFRIIIKL